MQMLYLYQLLYCYHDLILVQVKTILQSQKLLNDVRKKYDYIKKTFKANFS